MTALGEMGAGEVAFDRFRAVLSAAALLTSDLDEGGSRYFALYDPNEDPIGFAGLAGDGPDLLLRSVVVLPDARHSGLGAHLVTALEQEARAAGASTLWLLTDGAAPFFARLGFVVAERSDAPRSIAASSQFRALCPASAKLMRKSLGGATT